MDLISKLFSISDIFKKDNDSVVVIETNDSYSEVNFHEYNIIELRVTNTIHDNMEFYLHFQMNNIKHVVHLFKEMINSIHKMIDQPMTKILLTDMLVV